MIHLDLFSGIGGFAYAADQVWDNVEHIFCDNDKFCQQVLKKHWPGSIIYDDIRSITADTDFSRPIQRKSKKLTAERHNKTQRKSESSVPAPFILTGGFPCQPFSAAGLRRGTADDRHLWPEMLRVIRLTKPQWVIAENVRGLLNWNEGVVFEQVCNDLEAEGYAVQPFVIPAVAVNAPHRRDRIWFVGHAEHDGQYAAKDRKGGAKRADSDPQRPDEVRQPQGANSLRSNAKDSISQRSRGRNQSAGQVLERQSPEAQDEGPDWSAHWLEVATELCGVDDGLPAELDGFKLSKSQHRKERLKSLGNAIVPQVAMEIMMGVKNNYYFK